MLNINFAIQNFIKSTYREYLAIPIYLIIIVFIRIDNSYSIYIPLSLCFDCIIYFSITNKVV